MKPPPPPLILVSYPMSLPPDDRAAVLTSGARDCFKTCVPTNFGHTCVATLTFIENAEGVGHPLHPWRV